MFELLHGSYFTSSIYMYMYTTFCYIVCKAVYKNDKTDILIFKVEFLNAFSKKFVKFISDEFYKTVRMIKETV